MGLRNTTMFGAVAFALSGCETSVSSFNPLNWFSSEPTAAQAAQSVPLGQSRDIRPLIPVVSTVVLERTTSGVILRATGVPPTQGWFEADLVSETRGEPVSGVLTLDFRAVPPAGQTLQSTQQSREIVVGRFISSFDLAKIREIRVVGETNVVTVRP